MLGYDEEMHYSQEHLPKMDEGAAPINLNFSILQDYFDCAYRFKLSMFYDLCNLLCLGIDMVKLCMK